MNELSKLLEKYMNISYQLAEEKNSLENMIETMKKDHHTKMKTYINKYYDNYHRANRLEKELNLMIDNYNKLEKTVDAYKAKIQDQDGHKKIDYGSGLSIRILNSLKGQGIKKYVDLMIVDKGDLLRFPNFGRKSFNQLKDHIEITFPHSWQKFKMMENE